MCGIAGQVGFRGRTADHAAVQRMTAGLAHRGPDGVGEFASSGGEVALGHRRLSIIDLSEAGAQPMTTPDGELTLVTNGEIYNYLELRDELLGRGHRMHTSSDTEVMLVAYREWGEGFVERLRGMFAFALWDARRRCLLLARDRLGIKPVLVHRSSEAVSFCSELDPLRDAVGADRIRRRSLASFLRYRCVPAPHTIWEGIEKLPPGTLWSMSVDDGAIEETRYWDLGAAAAAAVERRARDFSCDDFRAHLRESVVLHTRADVPVGILLSGGLDSGSVVSLLRDAEPERDIATFSVGFGEARSELPGARAVAAACSTVHNELEVGAARLEDALAVLARTYGDPLADSSALPVYRLCELVAQHVKVALGGDGGDECFAGYKWYSPWRRIATAPGLGALAAGVARLVGPGSDRAHTALKAMSTSGQRRLDVLHGYAFDLDELSAAVPGAHPELPAGYHGELPADLRARVYDLHNFTVDAILYKVDAASMAHGLEVRVPFLDHEVVEYALGLPPAALFDGATGKLCLRRCVALPEQVAAGGKSGFSAPLRAWSDTLEELAGRTLPAGRAVQSGLLDAGFVKRLLERPAWRKPTKLWTLLTLESWLAAREGWR